MKKVMRWLLGTATVRVSGDTARLLNIAVKSGIAPAEMRKDGEDVLLTLRAKDCKKLHKIKQRTHARVKILEKSGLPFCFHRVRRRPGLLLGTVFGAALLVYLSGFYWEITLSGDVPYGENEILQAAKRVGIYIGAPRSVDTPLASAALLEQLPQLSWASFNTNGCTVQLEMRATIPKAPGARHGGTGDIVAARAGLIRSVRAESGTVLVKVGSACAAGQVLVSGVRQIGDPYDAENNPVRYLYSRARAQVMAETRRTFTAYCPLNTEAVRQVDLGTQKALYVLGLRVPLPASGAPQGMTAVTRAPLRLLGHTLPAGIETVRVYREESVTVTFTEEEAKRRALENLRQLQKLALGESGRVLSQSVSYTVKNNTVYVSAVCTCFENIAEEAPLAAEEVPESPENIGVFVGNVQGNG